MAKLTIADAPKVIGLRLRWDDDVMSNGVPPPPPFFAWGLGGVSVVSAITAMLVDAAVSADRGMVVTDVATGSSGVTDVVKVAEAAPGSPGESDDAECTGTTGLETAVGSEIVASGISADLSLVDSGTSLGLEIDVMVIVG